MSEIPGRPEGINGRFLDAAETVDVSAIIDRLDPRSLFFRILAWSCVIMLVDGADLALLSLAGPGIMADWRINRATFGQVLAAGQFGTITGAVLLGGLADRYGRRPVILGAVAAFGILSLAVPQVQSVIALAALRMAACCAIGGVKGTVYSLCLESCPRRWRGRAVGAVFAGYSLGQIAIALIAGLVMGRFGWEAIFYVGGCAALVVTVLAFQWLSESLQYLARRNAHDRLRRQFAAIGVPMAARVSFALGADGTAARGRGVSPLPLFQGRMVRITPLLWACEIVVVLVTSFYLNWVPTLAADLGASQSTASYALAAFSLGGMFGPMAMGSMLDRWGVALLPWMPAVAAAGVIATSLLVHSEVAVLAAMVVTGFLVMGVYLALAGIAFRFYAPAIRATAAGWYMFVGGLGSVSGPILVGWLMLAGVGARHLMAWSALPLTIAVPLCMMIARYFADEKQ